MSKGGFDEWLNAISEMPFEDRAKAIRDKIYEKTVFDEKSKMVFDLTFDYALESVSKNKQFDLNYCYTKIKEATGNTISLVEFSRVLALLEYCGFDFDYEKES